MRERTTLVAGRRGATSTPATIGIAAALAVLGIIVLALYQVKKYEFIGIALPVFWVADIGTWRYLLKKVISKPLEQSEQTYMKDQLAFELLRFRAVREYIEGSWHWWRFGTGMVLIVLVDVLIFSKTGLFIASYIGIASSAVLYASGTLGFVLCVESWIWWKRIKRICLMAVTVELQEEYELRQKLQTRNSHR